MTEDMTNEEILELLEEWGRFDDLIEMLQENGDDTTDLANNEHAMDMARELVEEELTCKNEN